MLLQFLNKILALILAFIVIFSSLSFTVEKHICMDEVTDVSFFTDTDFCGMTTDECLDDESGTTDAVDDQDCCKDIHEVIPGTQIEQQAINSVEIDQVTFIFTYAYTYLNLFDNNSTSVPFTEYNAPPITDKDFRVLYQTFLI